MNTWTSSPWGDRLDGFLGAGTAAPCIEPMPRMSRDGAGEKQVIMSDEIKLPTTVEEIQRLRESGVLPIEPVRHGADSTTILAHQLSRRGNPSMATWCVASVQ